MLMVKDHYIYQIGYKIDNFDLIITIIKMSVLILYQIETLMVVYAITSKVCMFYDRILFELNTGTNDMDLLAFHLTAMENDTFNLSIILINRIIIIIVQVDHSSVILIMTIHLWSIMLMDTFKMFFMLFDSNFCINIAKNNPVYTFVHGRLVINAFALIMIVIICQFHVRLCVLIHLNIGINDILTFTSLSNHSPHNIQSQSNDGQPTVQRGSNKGKKRVKNHNTKTFCNKLSYQQPTGNSRSITDYKMDGINQITLESDVYGMINYKLNAIDSESDMYCMTYYTSSIFDLLAFKVEFMISIITGYQLNITDGMINYKHDAIDATKTKFIIIIGYYLNLFYPKEMTIHIYDKIRYNMTQVKVEVDICI